MTIRSTAARLAATAALCLTAGGASAATLEFSITNDSGADGLFLTPFLSVFHDGSYDAFDPGAAASAGVEAIAEEGDVSIERAAAEAAGFTTAIAANPAGFPGAPVIDPGETASFQIDLDPTSDRYVTFLSMLIPSNDNFLGNANPFAYELFDASGAFTGIAPITFLTSEVWDAGTEVNDGEGAAFSNGRPSTDENGVITLQASLDFLLGLDRASGGLVGDVGGSNGVLATITVSEVAPIPLPAGGLLLLSALGLAGAVRRRR
ncbi:MAG: spondin domain-containing protein [Pseudomonadota bacterium]